MRYLRTVILFLTLFSALYGYTQQHFRVMFYNVENLFDCRHDSLKDDKEFLPDAQKRWSRTRYWRKLNDLAKVVAAISEERIPDLIGVCEVENDSVMYDWTRRSSLRALGYRYVMTHSPDNRGVDVALLYQPGVFKLLHHHEVEISLSGSARPTRNLLYAKGKTLSGDTLHVMVCHLPSRLGRRKESEERRICAAQTLRTVVDSIHSVVTNPKILVMGDFNADVRERIFDKDMLCAKEVADSLHDTPSFLFYIPETICKVHPEVKGTYRYQGMWENIDHVLLSPSLVSGLKHVSTQIMAYPFMCEAEKKYGGIRPFRTYQGPIYKRGYSDHFPIVVDLGME